MFWYIKHISVVYTLFLSHLTLFSVSHWKNNFFMEEKTFSGLFRLSLLCSHKCMKTNWRWAHSLIPYSETNCPLPPSSHLLLSLSILLLAARPGPFRITILAPNFRTLGAERHRSQGVKTGSLLSSSRPLVSASSAGVCHPPLSQTAVCLPVYCSWPGRLVGVQARLCLSHCETQQPLDFSLTAC